MKNTTTITSQASHPQSGKKKCSVALSTNDDFCAHAGALIHSLMASTLGSYHLDLIILHGGISERNKSNFKSLISGKNNVSIEFVDIGSHFSSAHTHMHFSKETYYRLMIDKLLPGHDKVLYLDSDMIACQDITPLYEENLEGCAIGAVTDYGMKYFCLEKIPSMQETGALPAHEYLQNYVGMVNPDAYFQAGMLLFNLKRMRELNLSQTLIDEACTGKRYWFLDQDILNKYFSNEVKFLDPKWNVINVNPLIQERLSPTDAAILSQSLMAPGIIHFAGEGVKPWMNIDVRFSEDYWKNQRQTPWYEQVLMKAIAATVPAPQHHHHQKLGFWKKWERSIRKRKNKWFPSLFPKKIDPYLGENELVIPPENPPIPK